VTRAAIVESCILLAACGGAGTTSNIARVVEADRSRAGLAGKDAQSLAPQAFAEAEAALRAAKDAEARGDTASAELHGERALAGFQRAVALARLARATEEEARANDALARATEQMQKWSAQRKTAEREADDLDKQLKIAREAEAPARAGPADPDREKARLVAAQALTAQARLLCSAARLVAAQAPGLAEAETTVADLEKKLEGKPKAGRRPEGAPIDAAARARSACLTSLTKARRASGSGSDNTDALLAELSQSADPKAKSTTDLAPARDERGVVVTLRNVFNGEKLAPESETTLKDLGRVAAAHPTFSVQVVLHDATAPSAAEIQASSRKGEAVKTALEAGGAAAAKIKVEQAGAKAPVVDPKDAQRRERNARVEVVFVPGT
jgi:outer membrane protein OmpA-like peptidoglycan-associated protein